MSAGDCALVTAAGHGVGRACAEALRDESIDLYLVDADHNRVEAAAERLDAHAITSTLADAGEAESCVATVLTARSRLDILVHVLATPAAISLADVSAREWREQVEAPLAVTLFLSRAALRAMSVRPGGQVLLVAPWAAVDGPAAGPLVTVVDTALHALTRELAPLADELEATLRLVTPHGLEPCSSDANRASTPAEAAVISALLATTA